MTSRQTKADSAAKKTRQSIVKDDDDEEEQEVVKSLPRYREEQSDEEADQSSSDDLFGEDEINEIAAESKHQNRQSLEEEPGDDEEEEEQEVRSRLRRGARSEGSVAKKRSALDMYEEEYNEDDDEEDREDRDSGSGDDSFKKPSKPVSKAEEFVVEEDDTSPLAEYTDYQRIQTRRIFIDKWISEPFFDEAVKGSFVRLFIGLQNDVQVYRMCEVIDVLPYKRPYRLPGTDIIVDRALLVGQGTNQKVAKMYHVSNSRILEKEFQCYVATLKKTREEDRLLRKNVILAR
jgi:RNA polymerase-associated protein RTF1